MMICLSITELGSSLVKIQVYNDAIADLSGSITVPLDDDSVEADICDSPPYTYDKLIGHCFEEAMLGEKVLTLPETTYNW